MRGINKSVVYNYLKKCHVEIWGYSETNIVKLANQLISINLCSFLFGTQLEKGRNFINNNLIKFKCIIINNLIIVKN